MLNFGASKPRVGGGPGPPGPPPGSAPANTSTDLLSSQSQRFTKLFIKQIVALKYLRLNTLGYNQHLITMLMD